MPFTRDTQIPLFAQHWQPKKYLFISIMAPMVLFLALVCAVELTAQQQQLHEQNLQQEHLADKANQVRTLLEYELNSTFHLATGLVSYIQSKGGILNAQEIDPWLSNLKERAYYMRNIGIAPNNTVTYIYPAAGNEAALGLHYPDNKEQWPAIQKVIASKRPLLAGPVHLQQGGMGLIYRVPVFLNKKDYWGLVSTVLNFDQIYELIHRRAEQLGIKIAIRDAENNGKILFGDKDVIANTEINLNIAGRSWQMIASQITPSQPSALNTMRVAGWLIALVISVFFNSFLRSLAQQNKMLHELSESKYRFSQAFNSAPQGIALIDHNGTLIDFNDSLCTTLGYARHELESYIFFNLAAPGQHERLVNIIEGVYPKPGANHQYESALLHKSGQSINVIISLAPTHANIYESDWIIQIIDISHRIAFEHLLQEEASYNQSILNAVVDGILIIDASGNIRSANPAASVVFDCPVDQFPHKHINQFVQDPETGSIMRHIKYHSAKVDVNNEINHNILGLKAKGQEFPLDLQLACVQRKNEKLFIAVVRDISERTRLENMKRDFIATISHELRTPLTAIQGSLRLMESGALGTFTEPVEKVIRIANQHGQELGLLIDDLLDMDKLFSGKIQLDFKPHAIYPLIKQTIERTIAYTAQHGTRIELLSEDEQLIANVDSLRLQQILANVLSHAIGTTSARSFVSIKVLNANHKIRIEIISPGEEPNNQYPHNQPEAVQRNNTHCSLAISRELISAMHGHLGISTEPGRGSCFFIELPLLMNNMNNTYGDTRQRHKTNNNQT